MLTASTPFGVPAGRVTSFRVVSRGHFPLFRTPEGFLQRVRFPAAPPAQDQPPRARQAEFVICDQTIENFFAKLKQYRAIATRYDKRAVNFLAAIHLAAAVIWLN